MNKFIFFSLKIILKKEKYRIVLFFLLLFCFLDELFLLSKKCVCKSKSNHESLTNNKNIKMYIKYNEFF